MSEVLETFRCFACDCGVSVLGDTPGESAVLAARRARRKLLGWHGRFTRFAPSELSLLNDDPGRSVPVSPLMARLVDAVIEAASMTYGLVDATQVDEIERAGYTGELGSPLELALALKLAGPRRPARPRAEPAWAQLSLDPARRRLERPPGVKIDSGGLAKGLFADVLADALGGHRAYAINCGGDLRIGGSDALTREVRVESPFDGEVLHTFVRTSGGIATSGIGRRSWLDERGAPAHHLLDPSTGRPAFTGVVQVTALAPTALLAEIRAKAAVLSGPARAASWLPDGGVIVLDSGAHTVVQPTPSVTLSNLQGSWKAA